MVTGEAGYSVSCFHHAYLSFSFQICLCVYAYFWSFQTILWTTWYFVTYVLDTYASSRNHTYSFRLQFVYLLFEVFNFISISCDNSLFYWAVFLSWPHPLSSDSIVLIHILSNIDIFWSNTFQAPSSFPFSFTTITHLGKFYHSDIPINIFDLSQTLRKVVPLSPSGYWITYVKLDSESQV